jgi:hypothetical protein
MTKTVITAFSAALLITSVAGSGHSLSPRAKPEKSKQVRQRLSELFAICQANNLKQAGAYCVYRGPDKARLWHDVYHVAAKEEREEINSICYRIRNYLEGSKSYEFDHFWCKEQLEGEWCAWEVLFRRTGSAETVAFAFLRVGTRYALGDIDRIAPTETDKRPEIPN